MALVFGIVPASRDPRNRAGSRRPPARRRRRRRRPSGPSSAPFWTGITDARVVRARDGRATRARARLCSTRCSPCTRAAHGRQHAAAVRRRCAGARRGRHRRRSSIQSVHPNEAVAAGRRSSVRRKSAASPPSCRLNRGVYDAINGLDVSGRGRGDAVLRRADAARLPSGRRGQGRSDAHADQGAARRAGARSARHFDRNIRDGSPDRHDARTRANSRGCPAITSPGTSPTPTASSRSPSTIPIRCRCSRTRRTRTCASGCSWNTTTARTRRTSRCCDQMLAKRAELAQPRRLRHLGQLHHGRQDGRRARSNASAFIDRIVAASTDRSPQREYAALLKRKQQDVPGATGVNAWERAYYAELVRKASYDFDSQTVRPYFAFDRVKQGLFDVTGRLVRRDYRPITGRAGLGSVGRSLRDAEGRQARRPLLSRHASAAEQVQPRRRIRHPHRRRRRARFPKPRSCAISPAGRPSDPGLMTHDDVETFFHEFGHLVHALLGGQHQWVGIGGISTEQDFVEAPSQMLEEWTLDASTLATFAKHYETNEPIPRRSGRADAPRRASSARRSACGSRWCTRGCRCRCTTATPQPSIRPRWSRSSRTSTCRIAYVEGTHMQTSFGHLDGYSAVYYTYMWSLVIAKDLFSQFDRNQLLAPAIAGKYRDTVLAPGGSKPAAALRTRFPRAAVRFRRVGSVAESRLTQVGWGG